MPRSVVALSVSSLLLLTLNSCGGMTTQAAGSATTPQAAPPAASDFYLDPNNSALSWVQNNPADSRASTISSQIASQPSARWFGDWSGDIASAAQQYASAAASAGKLPIMVAYNIPGRDCGQYSAGGAASDADYQRWIANFSKGIGSNPAVLVLEPDALGLLTDCLSSAQQQDRLNLLAYAVSQFASNAPNTKVYLDAGHADWIAADEMASRLKSANIAQARGFALNTSNYIGTASNTAYGNAVVAALNLNKRFVIDTSRNGNGAAPDSAWCNPAGRRVGAVSQMAPGTTGLEMLLWVKLPGESDGNCGIGAGSSAGEFLPQAAYQMAQ